MCWDGGHDTSPRHYSFPSTWRCILAAEQLGALCFITRRRMWSLFSCQNLADGCTEGWYCYADLFCGRMGVFVQSLIMKPYDIQTRILWGHFGHSPKALYQGSRIIFHKGGSGGGVTGLNKLQGHICTGTLLVLSRVHETMCMLSVADTVHIAQ